MAPSRQSSRCVERVARIEASNTRSAAHSSSPRSEVGTVISLVAVREAMAAAAAAASLQTAWCNVLAQDTLC